MRNYVIHRKTSAASSWRKLPNIAPPGFADLYTPSGWRDGDWRNDAQNHQGLVNISAQGSNNFTRSANAVRESFCDFFNSDIGAVPWQNELVFRTN